MDFRILGRISVLRDQRALALGPPKQRLLLAVLLSRIGEVVGNAALLDALWGQNPPASAVGNLYLYVHRLRKTLGDDRLPGQGRSGYLIVVDDDELDAWRFDTLAEAGRQAMAMGDVPLASQRLREALAQWRGRPYADLAGASILGPDTAKLEESRLAALEQRIEADLYLGRSGDLLGELSELVDQYPFRERFTAQLMRALYRGGRQAEALAVYRKTRTILRDQLGLDPSPELRGLEKAILTGDVLQQDPGLGVGLPVAVSAGAVSAAPVRSAGGERHVPAQLPPDIVHFTGRQHEVTQLDDLSSGGAASTGLVTIAITGAAGIGKTALTVHWAHRVREQFPDGQLFVNLRGFDAAGPTMHPSEAIHGFLNALDVPMQRIPATSDAQVALYRSLMSGRRMLVILDNAHDSDQVRQLLPGAPGCLVVTTSRSKLTGLVAANGAHPLILDLPTLTQARDLLTQRLGAGPVAAEPAAVDEIITSCARLPLALTIVAARAATNPQLGLGTLAAELHNLRDRLDALTGDDQATDVRAVLSWSYQALTSAAARLFRLLGLHPGPDVTARAAASLSATPLPQARRLLAELVSRN